MTYHQFATGSVQGCYSRWCISHCEPVPELGSFLGSPWWRRISFRCRCWIITQGWTSTDPPSVCIYFGILTLFIIDVHVFLALLSSSLLIHPTCFRGTTSPSRILCTGETMVGEDISSCVNFAFSMIMPNKLINHSWKGSNSHSRHPELKCIPSSNRHANRDWLCSCKRRCRYHRHLTFLVCVLSEICHFCPSCMSHFYPTSWISQFKHIVQAVGPELMLGTRLLSTSLFSSPSGRQQLATAIQNVLSFASPYIVAGTPYLFNYTQGSTAVTPAWRNSLWHVRLNCYHLFRLSDLFMGFYHS